MTRIGNHFFDIGYMDSLASDDSVLHRLDPRAKLITTLVFIALVVSFEKYEFSALIPFVIFPVIQISVGGLPAGYLLRKVLLVSPFAILIGIFNPLLDHEIRFYIGAIPISGGWLSFLSILTRFVLTVLSVLILIATTGFNDVCASLEKLGVPRPFVVQLMFLYRYLFVLTVETTRMVRAVSLRSFGSSGIGVKTFASMTGHLLLRTLDRAQRIHLAMLSRGFDGHIAILRSMRFGWREIAYIFGWSFLFFLFRWYNIPNIAGTFVTGFFS